MKKKNDWIKKGILIIVLLVCIAAYLWVPGIHKTMNRIFKMFASGDFTVVRDFVASYGVYACLLYTSPSPRDGATSRMPSSA